MRLPYSIPARLAVFAGLPALVGGLAFGPVLHSVPAAAAPAVKVAPGRSGARLTVGGRLIAIFRTTNGSLGPEQRAALAAERLTSLLESGLSPQQVEARNRGENWGVYGAGMLIMIATDEEAKERKEDARVTAGRWADNLRSALRESPPPAAVRAGKRAAPSRKPTLEAGSHSLVVPFGESRVVPIRGSASGPITVRVEGEETAAASVVDGQAAIRVEAVAPGRAVVRVGRDGLETAFAVWVKKYAGIVASTPAARVTGAPAPASLVQRLAAESALEGVRREPGAVVRVTGPAAGARALSPGETAQVSFPITISGGGFLELKTSARVDVQNLSLPSQDARVLLYSNDPESVREFGTLYEGLVDADGPARLMFHHQNRMGRPFVFQVHLINPGAVPVDVQVIEADAGPFIDPLQAGHRAAQRYLSATTKDIGYIAQIPARGSRAVYTARVDHLLTVSGIYNFRVMSGGPLVALVTAGAAESRPPVREDMLETARDEPHTYPSPRKVREYTYRVGDRWAFVALGREAISGKSANRKLFGNYGVVYDIKVEVNNPTEEERTIRVVLSPEAGWARGVFRIEGRIIEAPQLAPPGEAVLYSIKLGPGQSRRVSIQAIPAGGSAYPVSLVVRS